MIQFILGHSTVCETLNAGGNALATLQGLEHCAQQSSTADIFGGAVGCIVSVFQSIKAQGLAVPNFKEQHLNEFLSLPTATMALILTSNLTLRHEHAGQQVGALCIAVDEYRGKLSITDRLPNNVATQPVEPAKPSAPIEVVVIGMVTRETTTAIKRNSTGQIEGSSQIERDA